MCGSLRGQAGRSSRPRGVLCHAGAAASLCGPSPPCGVSGGLRSVAALILGLSPRLRGWVVVPGSSLSLAPVRPRSCGAWFSRVMDVDEHEEDVIHHHQDPLCQDALCQVEPALPDDRAGARLTAPACTPAPEGHDHWTPRAIAGRAV